MAHDDKLGIVAILSTLKDSDIKAVRKAANGTLWNLREFLQEPNKSKFTLTLLLSLFL